MKHRTLLPLVLLAAAIGCVPDKAYVAADRATLEASRPVFARDAAANPEQAQADNDLLRSWEMRVLSAEGK